MLERMTRGKFAKLAAAAPFVVLAMKSDGSREAAAQSVCTQAVTNICTTNPQFPNTFGPCTQNCRYLCEPAYPGFPKPLYANCPVCQNRVCPPA